MASDAPIGESVPVSARREFRVAVDADPATWLAGAASEPGLLRTPFQASFWLASWYATIGAAKGVEPALVTARDAVTGQVALLLPWVLSRESGLAVIGPADGGVSDYNGPILGPAAPDDVAGASALWGAIKSVLPPADLIRIEKMPRVVDGAVNPLALVGTVRNSALWGHVIDISGTFPEFLASRGKHFRKEVQRSRRVLEREGAVTFRSVADPDDALAVFATLEQQQSARMREAGVEYRLDAPEMKAFYHKALEAGLLTGEARLYSLEVDGKIVATVFGIADSRSFLLLRIANAGEAWKHCSPGRLIATEIVQWLMSHGMGRIDMTIGDYAFKRQFNPIPYPLVELVEARSWRALPVIARHRARDIVHRSDRLRGLVRRVRGQAPG
jgi:CelD/BcsL family acetyltransferase involved in cellulose biosynthesis